MRNSTRVAARGAMALAVLVLLASAVPASADQYLFGYSGGNCNTLTVNGATTFSTCTSEFTPGIANQGWWSDLAGNYDSNDNYIVGTVGSSKYNDFFTFDLTGFGGGATSAVLTLSSFTFTGLPVTYSLFDVSTPAATLNFNDGINMAIFSDLASGALYGSILVGGYVDPLVITLNANALAAINATTGFFSIGGTLSPAIPEPVSLLLFGTGLLGVGAWRKRRQ